MSSRDSLVVVVGSGDPALYNPFPAGILLGPRHCNLPVLLAPKSVALCVVLRGQSQGWPNVIMSWFQGPRQKGKRTSVGEVRGEIRGVALQTSTE